MSFSDKVLGIVKKIPKGKVTTYKAIANKLGTKAYRAVGNALRGNKNPVIVPCYRVVNSDGTVGGYCGTKKSYKKTRLLRNEGIEIINNKIDLKKYLSSKF
jgi:methylated-DNA-[protein]-cysteine S-methyltransferase